MSRTNTLYLGDANTVVDELMDRDASPNDLRLALMNALQMIAKLQEDVAALRRQVPDNR